MIQKVSSTPSNIILFLEGALCVSEKALVGLLVLEKRFRSGSTHEVLPDCCLVI